MIDQLTRRDFENLAPGSLQVRSGGAAIAMTVAELHDLPDRSPRAEPFSLVLQGPASPMLEQGIHVLVHPALGPLELFLVPIARDREHARYELIFN